MNPFLAAFLAGLASLGLEVLLVRMLSFFLGNGMDFLAIPLALLGLAIGSIYAHFGHRGPLPDLVRQASAAIPLATLFSLLGVFALFNLAFSRVHISFADPGTDAGRLLAYGAVLLPPFAAFGALFAGLFAANADRVGRLYAADLAGASAGCIVAPGLLTWFGLPAALVGVVWAALLLVLLDAGRSQRVRGLFGALGVVVSIGAGAGVIFREHPDLRGLAHTVLVKGDQEVFEGGLRWNELARTALLRAKNADGSNRYWVVQDNGLSNVNMRRYQPENEAGRTWRHHGLPWAMGREPKNILTMFAGAGRDMMEFDLLSKGTADITGVEINPAVRDLGLQPSMAKHRLAEFLAKPNVHHVIQEGRDFLDHDTGEYALIYVANNGAVHANRTGHTRKFLDTREAMSEYLDHLAPGGMMLFMNQPVGEKITSFKELMTERGLGDPGQAMLVFGRTDRPDVHSLVVVPSGLRAEEVAAVAAQLKLWNEGTRVLYAPTFGPTSPKFPVKLDTLAGRMVTDDRPFTRPLGLSRLRPIPSANDLRDRAYVSSWVKVFTVALFAALSGGAGLLVMSVGRGAARVPWNWVVYLLLTGIGYMCVEIGLIARTELFVGKPLYAVAINLAVFLVASAAGSWLGERRPASIGPLPTALATGLAVAWGQFATGWLTDHALSAPLVLKALGVAVAVGPAGMALGTFYPYAVSQLLRAGRGAAVPATYAMTTLSSVLGSAFAATAIVELGFSRVIALGAGCYFAACLLAWISSWLPTHATMTAPEVS